MLEKSNDGDMMIQKISNFKNISDTKNKNVLGKECEKNSRCIITRNYVYLNVKQKFYAIKKQTEFQYFYKSRSSNSSQFTFCHSMLNLRANNKQV